MSVVFPTEIDRLLGYNRSLQEELQKLVKSLTKKKEKISTQICLSLYDSIPEDVFFGSCPAGERDVITNEPSVAVRRRSKAVPMTSRYRREVGENYFVSHAGREPPVNEVTKRRRAFMTQLPPGMHRETVWKPTDDALLRKAVADITRDTQTEHEDHVLCQNTHPYLTTPKSKQEEQSTRKKALARPLHRHPRRRNNPHELLKVYAVRGGFDTLQLEKFNVLNDENISDIDWDLVAHEYLPRMTPADCCVRWHSAVAPGINKSSWKQDEDKKLKEIVAKKGVHDWEQIAHDLGTHRHPFKCLARYLKLQRSKYSPWTQHDEEQVSSILQSTTGSHTPYSLPAFSKRYRVEDATLRHQLERPHDLEDISLLHTVQSQSKDDVHPPSIGLYESAYGGVVSLVGTSGAPLGVGVDADIEPDWGLVASHVPSQAAPEVRRRWNLKLDPSINHAKFSDEEDFKLRLLNHVYQGSWVEMARHVAGRTSSQLRERWQNCVDPQINTAPWTKKEATALEECVAHIGAGHWREVSELLAQKYSINRNDAQCRKHWTKNLKSKLNI